MTTFKEELLQKMSSGIPFFHIVTHEEARVEDDVLDVARDFQSYVWEWTCTSGLKLIMTKDEDDNMIAARELQKDYFEDVSIPEDTNELNTMLQTIPKADMIVNPGMENRHIFLLKDAYHHLTDAQSVRFLRDIYEFCSSSQIFVIFVSPKLHIPLDLEKIVNVIDYQLPTKKDIESIFDQTVRDANNSVPENFNDSGEIKKKLVRDFTPSKDLREQLVAAAIGMTTLEAREVFQLAIVRHGEFNKDAIETIQDEKAQVVKKSGVLEYYKPPTKTGFGSIGGVKKLKEWLKIKQKGFTDKAREYGLEPPKGILLIGTPGGGKTLVAKSIGIEWGIPTLKFDVALVFDKYVGESEKKIDNVFKVADSIGNCVLWVDEIEKALAGSSGDSDGNGVTKKVLGKILTYMNDKTSEVFIVATANDPRKLPPELFRKGRFDESFVVDLPSEEERKEIFDIHIRKRKRDSKKFDLNKLAKNSENMVGAEIEEAVKTAMYIAFDENREFTTEDIITAIKSTKSLYETRKEDIDYIRDWAKDNARAAGDGAGQNMSLPQKKNRRTKLNIAK